MTTSNHPPFNIDLEQEGFNTKELEKILLEKFPTSPTSAKKLGHLWYSDKIIGSFIQRAETDLSQTLFVITGDHYGRRHVLRNPTLFDSTAVPFILYGKGITDNLQFSTNMAGSHLDIGSTLIELAAPKGFKYYTLGKNLLSSANSTELYGIGRNFVVSADNVIHTINENCYAANSDLKKYLKYYNDLIALAWWKITQRDAE